MKLTSRHSVVSERISGFTLIEILVVISITLLLAAIVGPMAVQNLERAEAKSELLSVKNWLRQISYKAFISSQELTLSLNGKQATIHDGTEQLIQQMQFEYVFFQPQELVFNKNGFVTPTQINGQYRNNELTLDLQQIINSDNEPVQPL